MKSLLLVLLLVGLACASLPSNDIWQNCGQPSDHYKIDSFTFSPDPPKIGQNISAVLKGQLDEDITDGEVNFEVDYYGVKLLAITKDVCQISPDYPCPFKQGPWGISESVMIPDVTPPGNYSGTLKITDQNKAEVLCVTFAVMLSK